MSENDSQLLPDELASAIADYLAGHGPEWGDGRPWPQTIAVDTDDLKSWHVAARRLGHGGDRERDPQVGKRGESGGVTWHAGH